MVPAIEADAEHYETWDGYQHWEGGHWETHLGFEYAVVALGEVAGKVVGETAAEKSANEGADQGTDEGQALLAGVEEVGWLSEVDGGDCDDDDEAMGDKLVSLCLYMCVCVVL